MFAIEFKECWEFSTPNIWNAKIAQLVKIIQTHKKRRNLEPAQIQQIKVKFGGLRFYMAEVTDIERKWITACERACDKLKIN